MKRSSRIYFPGYVLLLPRIALFITLLPIAFSGVYSAETARAKRVLMLFSESKFVPGNALVEQAAREVLLQNSMERIEFYAEYLDAIRFPGEGYYQLFRDYLREKYAQRSPDLVMAFLARKFELAGELPAKLFPGAPVVLAALTEEDLPIKQLGPHVTGVIQRVDVLGTFELILKLQPDTQRIVVIGGTALLDQVHLGRAEAAARSLTGRVEFDFWTKRSVPEMLKEVAALPPRTVILFISMFRDAAGVVFFPEQVVSLLTPVANVPVYVIVDSLIGKGAVGGAVAGLEAAGKRAGELAQRILSGADPASLPFEIRTDGVPMFDWRALKRWSISESRLPPGSVVRFKPPSMWEQYKWYVVGAFAIIALQAVMIADLLLQRNRRRRAQSELRESEQRMNLAASAAEIGLWAWDIVRDEVWITDKGRALFGFAKAERVDLNRFLSALHPEDREAVRLAVTKSLDGNSDYESEYRVVLPHGRTRWFAGRGQVEFDARQKPVRMRGVSLDITERKRAEERFRLAVEASPSAIVMVNQQGQIVLVNVQTEKLFGYSREELIGQSIEIFVPERFRGVHSSHQAGFFAEPWARVMGSGRDLFARRRDGTEFLADIGLYPIQTEEGTLVLTAIVDITERKRAELELQRHREELAHLTRVATVGELTASVAHELNQPLGAILSNAEAAEMFLMSEPPALDEVRDILADIRKDDQRASEVIRRIRGLLRKQELAPQPIEINEAVEEVLKLLSIDASARKVAMNFERTADLPRVWCDPVHLQQVLLNLVLNGMEAMAEIPEEQRQLIVRTGHGDNGMVKVAVFDCGPGIPTDRLPKLFEPFFTTKKGGMGMGLSIARTIVEAHHGQIWAENNRSVGATFYFTVPVMESVE